MLDARPNAVHGADAATSDVQRVLSTVQGVPQPLPSRQALYDHLQEQGFSTGGCLPSRRPCCCSAAALLPTSLYCGCLCHTNVPAVTLRRTGCLIPGLLLPPPACPPCCAALQQWLGSSLVPDPAHPGQLAFAFNAEGAQHMFDDYCRQDYSQLLRCGGEGNVAGALPAWQWER